VAFGHAVRRPLQSALLVAGVALGVAVVVAVDLANASALEAFRTSTEAVTGRATDRIVGGPRGIDQEVYRRLRVEVGYSAAAPVVQGTVVVREMGAQAMVLLGVDPMAEAPFRQFLGGASGGLTQAAVTSLMVTPGAVVATAETARRHGLRSGDGLTLEVGTATRRAKLVGLLAPRDELSRRALRGLLVADVSTAQELLGRVDGGGRLDRIDLILPADGALRREAMGRIDAVLPPGAEVVPASESRETVEAMTRAFQMNLTALSLLALLVGMFLIFNTVRFSVVQRRPTLATLRALGVTRREIFGLVMAEAVVLGAVGTGLGWALGAVLGRGAVGLVTRTINDVYYVLRVQEVQVPMATLMKAGFLGIAAAGLSAVAPAYEATAVPPVSALRRSDTEERSRRGAWRLLWGSLTAAATAAALLAVPGGRLAPAFAALGALALAFALAAPAVTLATMAVAEPLMRRLVGPVGAMGPRAVARALSRTAVAVAALAIAVCVSVGVRIMVDSFRLTVDEWLQETLAADVFISPPPVAANRVTGAVAPELVDELQRRPEVDEVLFALGVQVRSPDLGPVDVIAVKKDIGGNSRRYLEADGSPAEVQRMVDAGAVTITEPFARRHGLGVGDTVRLRTEEGVESFAVAGVAYDYSSGQGHVLMSHAVYRRLWRDDRVSSVALLLEPGIDADAFAARVADEYGTRYNIVAQSNRGLRRAVFEVFDRAFTIASALQLLAIVVAFMGVLTALMALQLERSRELATLRALGLTRGQMAAMSLLETGLMGTVAGLLSLPAGLALAVVLIRVINRRSFGWSLQSDVQGTVFAQALAVALAAALLAGAYPALKLGRSSVARALREE